MLAVCGSSPARRMIFCPFGSWMKWVKLEGMPLRVSFSSAEIVRRRG